MVKYVTKDNKEVRLAVIANWAQGQALSGGDRIFIELTKQWDREPLVKVHLFISQEGWQMCQRSGMTTCSHTIWSSSLAKKRGMLMNLIVRTLQSVIGSAKCNLMENTFIYSASDFWPDSIPAFIIKLKNYKIKWGAGFYLFAPKPWQKCSPYKGERFLTGLFYWLTQLPVYWVIKRYADIVFVTSEPDVEKFITKRRGRNKIVVVRGGVDTEHSEKYLQSNDVLPLEKRKYDACYIGRFHHQKGILELMDIWKLVCKKKTGAKLGIIGAGPLEEEVKDKVKKLGLPNNIELLGFKDGKEKYSIFKQSKIVVHPATYDSGGMAACEAMAWGLPGVSFDLEALKTYYPKGMVKTACFNIEAFAGNITALLDNKDLYSKTREDAIDWAREWDWNKRGKDIYKQIFGINYNEI